MTNKEFKTRLLHKSNIITFGCVNIKQYDNLKCNKCPFHIALNNHYCQGMSSIITPIIKQLKYMKGDITKNKILKLL